MASIVKRFHLPYQAILLCLQAPAGQPFRRASSGLLPFCGLRVARDPASSGEMRSRHRSHRPCVATEVRFPCLRFCTRAVHCPPLAVAPVPPRLRRSPSRGTVFLPFGPCGVDVMKKTPYLDLASVDVRYHLLENSSAMFHRNERK